MTVIKDYFSVWIQAWVCHALEFCFLILKTAFIRGLWISLIAIFPFFPLLSFHGLLLDWLSWNNLNPTWWKHPARVHPERASHVTHLPMLLLEIAILISQFWNFLFWNNSVIEMIDTHKADRCRVDRMLSPQCSSSSSSSRCWGLKLDHPQDLVGGIQ